MPVRTQLSDRSVYDPFHYKHEQVYKTDSDTPWNVVHRMVATGFTPWRGIDWLHTAALEGREVYTLYRYFRGHGIEWNYTHCKGFCGPADNPENCQQINCDYVHFEEYQTLPPYWIYT